MATFADLKNGQVFRFKGLASRYTVIGNRIKSTEEYEDGRVEVWLRMDVLHDARQPVSVGHSWKYGQDVEAQGGRISNVSHYADAEVEILD